MNELALITVAPHTLPRFSLTPIAKEQKELALSQAALVGAVRNAAENDVAVEAQKALKAQLNLLEKQRKVFKEPLLVAGRVLDNLVQREVAELEEEYARIGELVAGFQIDEQRRIQEEQRLQAERLAELERQKNAAVAAAKTPEEAEAITQQYSSQAYAESRPVPTTRGKGQRLTEDWEVTITNLHELARVFPHCVTITPKMGEIKALLDQGVQVVGVKAEKKLVAGVRTSAKKDIPV